MTRTALIVTAVLAVACARPRADEPKNSAAEATATRAVEMVGRVAEVGSDPTTWLALEPSSGGPQVRLVGAGAAGLRAVNGAVAWVKGSGSSTEITVEAFEIRQVGGQDVDDGIILVSASGVQLRLQSGATRAVPNATPALRDIAGARVWISRPVPGVTPSYGVITPRP